MTTSKYLQKNAAEQDTASNTTLSPNEPTESNSSSLSEPKPSVVTAEQTPENKPKNLWGNCSGKASASYFRQCCY